ncbi:MAG: hypothetical protein HFJ68_07795 [Adlercreutzia caecimuris]|uniref:hypothetical protein n=1 Tax=Adlercreutzia caecimuris TaxID=671266 RepID=UPI00242FC2DE|nr:hypothetical protein [Adlercreutzia caecimuris]MCI9208423.1 hypothetical protein [Adlercreutzia caecimuris]
MEVQYESIIIRLAAHFSAKGCCVIIVGLLSLFSVLAFAPQAHADDLDTGYMFYLKSKGATDGTGWRHKGAEGSAYIHIMEHRGDHCRLYIDGALDREGRGAKNCMVGEAWADRDGQYRIHNTVRDAHMGNADYHYARLTAWAPYGEGSTNGVWSPDCSKKAEKLPILNIE